MKQGTAKTLGVAALGAAFAAVAAGPASAAPGDVLQYVPTEKVTKLLPPGASQTVADGQNTVSRTAANAMPIAQQLLRVTPATPNLQAAQGTQGVKGLLGGLPLGNIRGGSVGLG
ncbi:ATP-binding protein [Streptomyces sp. KR80]|uniref:ATP-binding protein n=1 Tax=Streptomyces sp. KR80 TaxID=3457426 RepID=UPI003FD5D5FF